MSSVFYCYDANGNVTELVGTNGTTVATYVYDPYGNLVSASGGESTRNPFRFSTKYFDGETDLYYYGLRYFSPDLGRFPNRDPIAEQGGLLLYGFGLNNPINGVDPFGLSLADVIKKIGKAGIKKGIVGWFTDKGISFLTYSAALAEVMDEGPYFVTRYRVNCPAGCKEKKYQEDEDQYYRKYSVRVGLPVLGLSFSGYDFDGLSFDQWYTCCCETKWLGVGGFTSKKVIEDALVKLDYGFFEADKMEAVLFSYEVHELHVRYTTDWDPCKSYCKPKSYWTEISLNGGKTYIKVSDSWKY